MAVKPQQARKRPTARQGERWISTTLNQEISGMRAAASRCRMHRARECRPKSRRPPRRVLRHPGDCRPDRTKSRRRPLVREGLREASEIASPDSCRLRDLDHGPMSVASGSAPPYLDAGAACARPKDIREPGRSNVAAVRDSGRRRGARRVRILRDRPPGWRAEASGPIAAQIPENDPDARVVESGGAPHRAGCPRFRYQVPVGGTRRRAVAA